jgi:uncharacterized membrane protein YdjX (TVP38/TMEM64 family)
MEPANSPETRQDPSQRPEHLTFLASSLGFRPDMPDRREYLFFLVVSILTFMGTMAFLSYVVVEPFRQTFLQTVLQPDRLRTAFHNLGYWGPLFFVMGVAVQVIFMIWPAPMELVGGYLFGAQWGLVYSTLGLVFGSMVAFLLGRWLEKIYFSRRLGPDKMKLIRTLMKREGALAGFLIFLLPGVPKDFLCFIFGMTRIPLLFFLAVSTLARLPGTFLFTFQGAQAHKGNYGVILVLLAIYAGLAFWLYRHRQAVYQWLDRWHPDEK